MIIFRTHSLTDLLEHQIWIEIHLFIVKTFETET